jgi:hypothetical protein
MGDLVTLQNFSHFWLISAQCAETSFPVHRSVMAAASPFFRAMLSVEMRESGQDVIELKDMDADAMEAVNGGGMRKSGSDILWFRLYRKFGKSWVVKQVSPRAPPPCRSP